ncbi:hypothetical protein ACF08M_27140 [Streptomyces sp. NPDC015032]|uniref:hypothetical protein n=1 Tax=Streptomyces sp. NPDC015032 TaxID=3364937 RepID=UPI0036FA8213
MAVLYQSGGYSLERLASLYKVRREVIRALLQDEGVEIRAEGTRGTSAPVVVTMAILYDLGLSIDRVGWLCGYTYGTARKMLLAAGVELRPRGMKLINKLDVPRLVRLYESPLSIKTVADMCGMSYGTARDQLLRAGVTLRPPSISLARQHIELIPPAIPLSGSTVVQLHGQGFDKFQIRRLTGRSHEFVDRRLTEHGLRARVGPDRLGIDTEQLVTIYRSVASSDVTAEVLHLSASAVLARLREAGQPLLDAPDPEAAPSHVPGKAPWQYRDEQILARAARGERIALIAAAVDVAAAEVAEVIRIYRHRDRTTAEILRRRTQGESAGVIAVRMGLRLDSVNNALDKYETRHRTRPSPRRADPLTLLHP